MSDFGSINVRNLSPRATAAVPKSSASSANGKPVASWEPSTHRGSEKERLKKLVKCPTCGKAFVRLLQHKCKDSPVCKAEVRLSSSSFSVLGYLLASWGPQSPRETENEISKETENEKSEKRDECPTCGELYVRLWQHRCKKSPICKADVKPTPSYFSVRDYLLAWWGSALPVQPECEGLERGDRCPNCGEFFCRALAAQM